MRTAVTTPDSSIVSPVEKVLPSARPKTWTLKTFLARSPRPSEQELLALLAPLTDALETLHREQCVHRDIAPDNILLLGLSRLPLLLDFGAARHVVGSMTQDLTAILKSGYAPLEQYGEIPGMKQGPWTDVYALAAAVHYALRGETPPPAVARVVSDAYVPLLDTHRGAYRPGFLRAIDRALAVRPEARTPSIACLRQELGLGTPAADVRGEPVATAPRRVTTRRVVAVLAGAGLVIAAAATMWAGHRFGTPVTAASGPASVAMAALPALPAPKVLATAPVTVATAPPAAAPRPASPPAADPAIAELRAVAAEIAGVLKDMEALGRDEKRDVKPAVVAVEGLLAQADEATAAGDTRRGLAIKSTALGQARGRLNALVDELVSGYGQLAERARAAKEFELAQQAVDRAAKVKRLRR